MRLVLKREALRGILSSSQRVLFTSAALLLGYFGFVLADAWVFQQRESRELSLLEQRHKADDDLAAKQPSTSPAGLPSIAPAGLLGRLEIARLGLSAIVVEGDDQRTLRRAVGHIPGTPLPGHNGNVALTAHRDTFFRPLRNIRRDDIITLTTLQGRYLYRVLSIE